MSDPLTDLEKIRRLPYQVIGSFLNSVFCVLTFVGSVFILFLNELGLDKARIGVLLSLIPFSQLIALFITPVVARLGYRRMFLTFFGARKLAIALLLGTPWIVGQYGLDAGYFWVLGVILAFSICRALAESAIWPWAQEIVPNNIRGKFGAVNTTISTIGFIGAVSVAGFVISHYQTRGPIRFVWLIAAGILAGMVSLVFYAMMPGGKPERGPLGECVGFAAMRQTMRDQNFMRFLAGLGFVTFALGAMFSFVPLYMKEQVGLSAGFVVWLDIGGYMGFIVFCYLWGWAADRYGSKPVMLTTLSMLLLMPLVWFLMPRHHALSGAFAMAAAFVAGAANIGWAVTFTPSLLVSAVPPARKTDYMALFYAWAGLTTGAGPLAAGWLIEFCRPLHYELSFLTIDLYSPLFALGFISLLGAILVLSTVQADGAIPVQHFIGMFFQGNPVTAMANLLRYRLSGDEFERITVAQQLGRSGTLLSAEELIDALRDPSYNVRHEAIHAIGSMPPHPRLIDALLVFLGDNKTDLSLSAAYALGKMKAKSAVVPLRETLLSEYRLLRARSARSLAMLGDTASCPFIHAQLKSEQDLALRIAYASALGALQYADAFEDIRELIYSTESPTLRAELALALARLVGHEQLFVRLWRRLGHDTPTSTAQIVLSLQKRLPSWFARKTDLRLMISECATAFGQADLLRASRQLDALCDQLPLASARKIDTAVIRLCRESPSFFEATTPEYIVLLLHTLVVVLRNARHPHQDGKPAAALSDTSPAPAPS